MPGQASYLPGTDGVVIDDERLQELLTKASSLYNNGEYKGAIEAWEEALGVDPASQKAREGIRMATLLLGDSEATPAERPGEAVALPADGVEPGAEELSSEEAEARIDLGVARLKQLLAERKYAEAIEGARGLLPLDPDSPEIQRLLEEAQHAFESAPFIEEHLALARELLKQERFSDAEAECKKVFMLDAAHPGGKTLLKQIRDKIQESLKDAASQLGGMTVKLTMPQAIAAGVRLRFGGPAETPAALSPKAPTLPLPEVFGDPQPADGERSQGPVAGDEEPIEPGVAPGGGLESAFEGPSQGAVMPEEPPFELAGESATGSEVPAPAAEEVIEAQTIRPPSSRIVPRGPVLGETAAPAQAEPPTDHRKTPAPSAAVQAPPVVAAPAKKAPQPPITSAPEDAAAGGREAAPPAPPGGVKVADVGADATAAWEMELTQLNLKDKERGLLRGTGAKATGSPVQAGEMDLMSLLDSGGMPGLAGSEGDEVVPQPEAVVKEKERTEPAEHAEAARPRSRDTMHAEGPAAREAPVVAVKLRAAGRPRPASAAARRRSSKLKYLLLLVVLLGGGWAAWHFDLQPRGLDRFLPRIFGGGGQPGQPVAPPAGSPGGTVDGAHGPIPTPIGGTSRQQAAPQPQNEGASVPPTGASPEGQAAGVPTAQQNSPATARLAGTPALGGNAPGSGAASVAGVTASPAPKGAVPSSEPIKPPSVPAMSRAEMQTRIAAYTADGRRLLGLGKWREARAKLNAVLALDPANMEVKDLADQAQRKIDEDQQLMDEFDSVKSLYADKDYENALRKLYRLPRDKGLGDIDLYIRNSWFNWAVVVMKAGNTKDALTKLSEELAVDPDDAAALKLQEVAEKYSNRAKDRTYYAFADGLALRAFDQK